MQQSQSQLHEKLEQKHGHSNTAHRRASTTDSADRDHKTPRRGVFRKASLTERKLRNALMQTNYRNVVLPVCAARSLLQNPWPLNHVSFVAKRSRHYLDVTRGTMVVARLNVLQTSCLSKLS
jgi:hypothetical protein